MATPKPVLIAGAGIASLLLAQSLRRSQIPFKIFERDASFAFRAQGYRLRLSEEGLNAIESVLSPEAFQEFWTRASKTGGMGFVSLNAITGETVERKGGDNISSRGGKVVGIARGEMRNLFAKGCEEHIEWSKKVTAYEVLQDGVKAVFDDGSKSVEGSLLVGGEGIYSSTAKQLSGGRIKTFDTGARGIHGQAPSTAFAQLGEGVFGVKDNKGVFLITNVRPEDKDDPNALLGWTMGGHPGVIEPPGDDYAIVGKKAAEMAKSLTQEWHARLRPLIENIHEPEAAFWKITCSSPSGVPEWPNEPRVTVIGDAVHSMTPAGGLGANTAVQDAALLGKLLREAKGFAPGVTAAYEKEMRVYGSKAVAQSYASARESFGIDIDESTTPRVH